MFLGAKEMCCADVDGMKINEEAIKIFFKKADEVFAN